LEITNFLKSFKMEKYNIFNLKNGRSLISLSFIFLVVSLFLFTFSLNFNSNIVYADELNETNETEIINFTYYEPTKKVINTGIKEGDNIFNSKSYYITLTGNEMNFDIDYELLEDGQISITLISPEISKYDNLAKIGEKTFYQEPIDDYNARVSNLTSKYGDINVSRKTFYVYDNIPIKDKKGAVKKLEKAKLIGSNYVYNYIFDSKEDSYLKIGENSVEVELSTDLVSYYKFDEISGTNAEDSHGTNDGTANNARVFTTEVDGIINTGADFTGGNDYIEIDSIPVGANDAKTISMWVKTPATLDSTTYGMISTRARSAPPQGFIFSFKGETTSTGRVSYAHTGEESILDSALTIATNTWYHLVVTTGTNGNGVKVYFNGNEVADGDTTAIEILE